MSRAIFDKLRNARYSNNQPIFDLGFSRRKVVLESSVVGDFEIVERRLDFGNAEQRRKTRNAFEILGQTYFLIRDRVDTKKIYTTDSPAIDPKDPGNTRGPRRTRHTSLNEDDK